MRTSGKDLFDLMAAGQWLKLDIVYLDWYSPLCRQQSVMFKEFTDLASERS